MSEPRAITLVNPQSFPEHITSGVSSAGTPFFLAPSSLSHGTAEETELSEEGYQEAARRWNGFQAAQASLDAVADLCEELAEALKEEEQEYNFGGGEDEYGALQPGFVNFTRLETLLDRIRKSL